eukprot:8378410-Heterocapsa_arctica.AAC.1
MEKIRTSRAGDGAAWPRSTTRRTTSRASSKSAVDRPGCAAPSSPRGCPRWASTGAATSTSLKRHG